MDRKACLGIVLAGGQSSRMGQDKALLKLDSTPLITHAIRRLQHQLKTVIISAQKQQKALAKTVSVPIVPDLPSYSGFGPLAGILSTMEYAQTTGFHAIITIAVDTPFFPENYAAHLIRRYKENTQTPVIAVTGNVFHPTFALWPVSLLYDLHHYLRTEEKKSILAFARHYPVKQACFATRPLHHANPFFNINTPDEFAHARIISAAIKRENIP